MLERSWKQLMICFTRKPGSDSAAVTAASGSPCAAKEDSCQPLCTHP